MKFMYKPLLNIIISFQSQISLMDQSPNNHSQSCQDPNCCKISLSRPYDHESLFSQSRIRPQEPFDTDGHSLINSFSLKYLMPCFPPDSRVLQLDQTGYALESQRLDTSLPYLSLSRGISQNYEYFEDESYQQCLPYSTIRAPSAQQDIQQPPEMKAKAGSCSQTSFEFLPISEQELKSHSKSNDLSDNSLGVEEFELIARRVGVKVTKNVTKNIGKLLFKFIWKHQRTLGQQLKIQKCHWESFMKVISLWKKQNNITRQYLMQRWHGQGDHCRLFRVLSRHFFRKRCLPAIMRSHIRLKRVHFERIHRFSAAITDHEALSSLV